MNDQLISLNDESLDQVAGGALITVDVSGAVKGIAHGVAEVGEAAFGILGALAKFTKGVVGAVGHLAHEIVEIK
jgi:hypothetical protein